MKEYYFYYNLLPRAYRAQGTICGLKDLGTENLPAVVVVGQANFRENAPSELSL